jgi:transcriptional regulator with XRE-family HTH domain
MTIGARIKELRNKKGWTQKDLGNKVGLTYIQIGRYEKLKATPSSDVLQRIAQVLDTTGDYLMNGSAGEQANQQIKDKELLQLFTEIEVLEEEDKKMVKLFLGALITKRKLQQIT